MKNLAITLALVFLCFRGLAQQQELQQLALNTQKLAQFKSILRDMKSGYDIISKGYGNIKTVTEGNFKLHQAFLDGLYQVSPSVRNYQRVPEIIRYQTLLVKEYKASSAVFKQVSFFSADELVYFERVYDNLLKQSFRNLNELARILTAGEMRMSDDERIQAIDRIYVDMERKLSFLRSFSNEAKVLGVNRAKQSQDINALNALYGLTK